jgi:hypothetical protein
MNGLDEVRHMIVKNSGLVEVLVAAIYFSIILSTIISVTLITLSPQLQAQTVSINSSGSNNVHHSTLSPTYSPVFSADSKPYMVNGLLNGGKPAERYRKNTLLLFFLSAQDAQVITFF